MNEGKPLKIYLIAGEASGDLLGAHLMRSLKTKLPEPPLFYGIGGDKMAAEGLSSLFPHYELSMMGFIEILPYIFNLSARIGQAIDDIRTKQPDIVITIDSPGFCFRVVDKLRKENFQAKFLHYVAPTVWAYKPERAEKCARLFDHLLCLLPFEPPYFERVNLPCTWVGHPVVVETQSGNAAEFRKKYELSNDTPLFCLLPGSRKGEVERHMPIFRAAIALLATQYSNLAIAVAVPKNVLPFVTPFFEGCPFRAIITANEQDKKSAIAASQFAIVKSGTVALEVAIAGTPMLVAYRVNALSALLLRWMISPPRWLVWLRRGKAPITLKYVNLINILEDRESIPELLQELCHPMLIADASANILDHANRRNAQQQDARHALAKLTPENGRRPSDLAADTVLSLLH